MVIRHNETVSSNLAAEPIRDCRKARIFGIGGKTVFCSEHEFNLYTVKKCEICGKGK